MSYEFKSSVDNSGYVSLVSRVHGACRCSVCSADPEIVKFYVNDVLCKFDSSPCSSVSDLGVRVCSWKRKGSICHCERFVASRGLRVRGGK